MNTTLQEIENLANELMSRVFHVNAKGISHSHSAKEIGYTFKWDRATSRFGCCKYVKKVITLSKPICEANLDKLSDIRDTILHEIAHALCVHIYGRELGRFHDWRWREIALVIGCNGERCYDGRKMNNPPSKYSLVCPSCDKKTPYQRKPKKTYACGKCCKGTYNPKYKMNLVQNY